MTLQTESLKIKDLGNVITGGTPPTKQRHYYGDKIPLIKPTDMVLGQRYIGNTEESLSDAGIAKFKNKLVPAFTPCVVTIGTIGKSCLTKEKSLVNQAVNCVVVNTKKFDIMYIYYLLQLTIPTVKSLNSGTASGRENVSKSVFENIDVKVISDMKSQVVIGRYLSNYDSLMENNNRRIAILEDMAQSLYREWFVNFRYPNYQDNLDADGNPKFIDSPLGQIPEGWEVKRLDDVASVNPQSITKKNAPEEIGYIDIKSVGTGTINEVKAMAFDGAPSRARRVVIDGDIIWATVRPNRKQFSYICKPAPNTIASTGFAVLRSKNLPASYLYSFTTTDSFTGHLVNHATGSAYPAVNADIFQKADILVPPKKLMEKFDELCSDAISQSEVLKKKNKNLKQQRDMLLPKLISGQIEL